MGRFGCTTGRFGQCNGPFWTIFLEIKIFGAVLVGAVLAMGRFGIDPLQRCHIYLPHWSKINLTHFEAAEDVFDEGNTAIPLPRPSCLSLLSNIAWVISLSRLVFRSAKHTHRPQGVNYQGYLHVLKFLLLLCLNRKA